MPNSSRFRAVWLLPEGLQLLFGAHPSITLHEGQGRLRQVPRGRLLGAVVPHQASREPHALPELPKRLKKKVKRRLKSSEKA